MKNQGREFDLLYGHFLDAAGLCRRALRNGGGATDAEKALEDAYVKMRAFLDGKTNIPRDYLEAVSSFVEATHTELQARESSRKLVVA